MATSSEKRQLIQSALQRGAVCVSVSAWYFDSEKNWYYKPAGSTDNHWVLLVQAEADKPYKIFDHYDPAVKELDPLYDFQVAKVYFLQPATHLFLKNLGFQMTDPEVSYLQKALIDLGYVIPNGITNIFGTETRSAVMAFQRDNGISDTGEHFGPRTRLALNRSLQPNLGAFDNLILTLRTYAGI